MGKVTGNTEPDNDDENSNFLMFHFKYLGLIKQN